MSSSYFSALLLLLTSALLAAEVKTEPLQFGARSNLNYPQFDPFEQLAFVGHKASYHFDNSVSGWSLNYHLRLSGDFGDNKQLAFSPLDATVNYKGEQWAHSVGMQIVSFSETFGVNIMDIVNPRDYRLGIFDDLEWSKQPIPLWVTRILGDAWSFELYFSPYGSSVTMAEKDSEYDVYSELSFERQQARDHRMEGGFRFNYLLDCGLDLNFIYYRHMNRQPFYYLNGMVLQSTSAMVDSYGLTYSYSFDSVVLRGDYLATLSAPTVDDSLALRKDENLHQAILGIDWTEESGLTLGGQVFYHSSHRDYWAAMQIQKTGDDFVPSLMYFYGLNNSDAWLRPELSYKGFLAWEFRLRADLLQGEKGEGQLSPFVQDDRFEIQALYFY